MNKDDIFSINKPRQILSWKNVFADGFEETGQLVLQEGYEFRQDGISVVTFIGGIWSNSDPNKIWFLRLARDKNRERYTITRKIDVAFNKPEYFEVWQGKLNDNYIIGKSFSVAHGEGEFRILLEL